MAAKPDFSRSKRPKDGATRKKVTGFNIDEDAITWMRDNLPRTISLSAFANEALWEKIARYRRSASGR